jgi:pimeloyl-ACP methyl ester carboxylesterase
MVEDFRHFFYTSRDGLRLHAGVYGEAREGVLPAICLPGLTRNARDFHELALHLSREADPVRQVVAFDYRGRGQSDYDTDWEKYDPLVEAGDIIDGLAALDIGHGGFIGTSRGGLIIMLLAAIRPALLKAAVLNDVGPVIEGAGVAAIRAYLERAPKPKSFAEAVQISKAASGPAFPALTAEDWERTARALYRDENGRPVADFDHRLLKTLTAVDFNEPLPVLWPQFMGLAGIPVLAIRGEHSKLLSARTLKEMARRHPRLETVTVEGQGHAPLLETAGLPERIAAFLKQVDA